tara:strand:+ start:400 stop:624 length:225 start_codon:yes stop_codon:yes gene_type:complete
MNDPSKHKVELHDQVRKLMEESGKDPIDKETSKQIAISIAMKNDDTAILKRLQNNHMLEQDIIQFIGGNAPSDM